MKSYKDQNQVGRVVYNLALITTGSLLMSLAVMGIFVHKDFMVSGVFGSGLLVYYATGLASPAIWYALFCIPVGLVAYFMVSRRFFLYSVYAICQIWHFLVHWNDKLCSSIWIVPGVICLGR